jgi:NADPH:quinone reductase-like Zn-dependent oxidoreductase
VEAIVQDRYGQPAEVLALQAIDRPVIGNGEVLVGVVAASINIGDCHMVRGVPYIMRPVFGLRGPRKRVPGVDFAGKVEEVGPNVTSFEPGDEVFGWGSGAFAECVRVEIDNLAPKPTNLTLEQAAAVGVSAQTALQALRDHGKVRPGQSVLVNGASGGVGTYAVQIAKALGAEVTGVCSTRNLEMVASIGADHVIDYTQDDFTHGEQRYDFILDNVGNHSLSDTRRALAADGTLLSNGAPVRGWIGGVDRVALTLVQSLFVRQQLRPFVSSSNKADLAVLKELVEAGKVTPVIDRTYPLNETAAAIQHVREGHAQGKTIITVQH